MDTPALEETRPIPRLYFRPEETPQIFGFSRAVLYRLAAAGEVRIYKLGTMTLFKVAEVIKLIEEGRA